MFTEFEEDKMLTDQEFHGLVWELHNNQITKSVTSSIAESYIKGITGPSFTFIYWNFYRYKGLRTSLKITDLSCDHINDGSCITFLWVILMSSFTLK